MTKTKPCFALRAKSLVGLLVLAITVQFPVQSQSFSVGGTVSTVTAPVLNALVVFEDQSSGLLYSALTDSSGQYELEVVVSSVEPPSTLPETFTLGQNYPNPFSSSTTMPYELTSQADVQITIYDMLGRAVRTLRAGFQSIGLHRILWNGKNDAGQKVAAGVYFYRLQVKGQYVTRKMVFGRGDNYLALMPATSAPEPAATGGKALEHVLQGTFTVRIQATDSTYPSIVPKQIDNVGIESDTTLNVAVVGVPVSEISVDSLQQYIRGFGAANILPWRPDMTTDEVYKGFGTGPGQIGFSMLRLRVPYVATDQEFSAQVPTATLAQSLGAIVFASPWSPPPSMKSNGNIVGGTLLESSYAAYAAHLKGFADYMSAHGAPLYGISVQNEPDVTVSYESCDWDASQMLKFVKENGASIGTRVIVPESFNFNHTISDSILNDPIAAANVAIIGGHIYGGGVAPYPLATGMGKELWMTEHLVLDTSWTAVMGTATEIMDCMNAGMNAYVWWYIVRYYGPIGEDGNVTKRGYVMSQYARFIRPGFHKVKCNGYPQRNVYLTSYVDSLGSSVVIVALNMSTSAVQQTFETTGDSLTVAATYTTTQSKDCERGPDITVWSGRFTATLEPSSVTTFVVH